MKIRVLLASSLGLALSVSGWLLHRWSAEPRPLVLLQEPAGLPVANSPAFSDWKHLWAANNPEPNLLAQAATDQGQNQVPLLTATCPSEPAPVEDTKKQQVAVLMKDCGKRYKKGFYATALEKAKDAHELDPDNGAVRAAISLIEWRLRDHNGISLDMGEADRKAVEDQRDCAIILELQEDDIIKPEEVLGHPVWRSSPDVSSPPATESAKSQLELTPVQSPLKATGPSNPTSEEDATKQRVAELLKECGALYKKGRYGEALEIAHKAWSLDPNNPEAMKAVSLVGKRSNCDRSPMAEMEVVKSQKYCAKALGLQESDFIKPGAFLEHLKPALSPAATSPPGATIVANPLSSNADQQSVSPPNPPEPRLNEIEPTRFQSGLQPGTSPTVEGKLDQILVKLEQLEKRLDAIDKRRQADTLEKLEQILERVNQLESRLQEAEQGKKTEATSNPFDWLFELFFSGPYYIKTTDPNVRIRQLTNQSDGQGTIQAEWERIWFTDHPSHLTPNRVEGAIQ